MALFATILFASLIEVKHIDKAIQIDQILDLIVLGLLDVLGADVVIWFSLGFNLFGRIAVEVVYAYDVESVNQLVYLGQDIYEIFQIRQANYEIKFLVFFVIKLLAELQI